MKQFGSRDSFCILVLSPRMEPPVMELVGSTTEARLLYSHDGEAARRLREGIARCWEHR